MTEYTQQEVVDFLNTEMRKIFPTSGIRAHLRRIIGETNIYFLYTNNATAADCASGILENDPAFMHFAIYPNAGAFHIEKPTMHRRVLKNAGIHRFMTMKASTEMGCAVKLVEFMRKNSANFLKLGR